MKRTAAVRNWAALDLKKRFAIAAKVARKKSRALIRRYPNVRGVGVGFRTSGTDRLHQDEVVLRFSVARKRKRITQGKIPRAINTFWRFGRRRRALAIPTDVFEHSSGSLHSPFKATLPGGASFNGSACSVLVDRDTKTEYLLGCHHVFTGSLHNANLPFDPVPGTRIDRQVNGSAQHVGPCGFAGKLRTPPGEYAMDAAFLELNQPTSFMALQQFWTVPRPAKLARFPDVPTPNDICEIHSFRGVIPAQFVALFNDMDVAIGHGVVARFEYVIETFADTAGGDSGSALMDTSGTLYGLHFYGGQNADFARNYSLAIPVWNIVGRQRYFKRDFDLKSPHP